VTDPDDDEPTAETPAADPDAPPDPPPFWAGEMCDLFPDD